MALYEFLKISQFKQVNNSLGHLLLVDLETERLYCFRNVIKIIVSYLYFIYMQGDKIKFKSLYLIVYLYFIYMQGN